MKRVNFFSGMSVQQEDLAYLQNTLNDEIKSRTANQYSKGVVSPVGAYVGVDTNQTLRIYPFTAYTESGERIVVPSNIRKLALDLTDDSNRQLGTQGFLSDKDFGWRSDTPYLIVARYSEEGARPRPHYRTRKPYATRIYSGFKFFAMREGIDPLEENGINPFIVLARAIYTNGALLVTTNGITEYAGMDASRVNVTVGTNVNNAYDISQPVTVDQHIRSIGNLTKVSAQNPHGITAEILGLDANAVPDHENVFHAPGFIGDPKGVNSCFYTQVNARSLGVDYLKVQNLTTGDNLHYKGVTIKTFLYNTSAIYIALSDDSGIWPDGTYTIFADLRTKEIGVAANNAAVVSERTYSIIYNSAVQSTLHPINMTAIDSEHQYVLYTFTFKQEKDYSEIDLQGQGVNKSNFITQTDYRVFGSISSANLQRNAAGDFVVNFPIKTPLIKFSDNTELTSANSYPRGYIEKGLRLHYNGTNNIIIGSGSCKDSTNSVVMTLPNDMNKNIFSAWSAGDNNGSVAPGLGVSAGTWHVFLIGTTNGVTDIALDTAIDASHCVISDESVASPISGYRYYRRIGSIYIIRDSVTDTLQLREFITIPDSGYGVTTVFTVQETNPKEHITSEGGVTTLPIPSSFIAGTSPKYSYMKVKLNISSNGGAYFREYLPATDTAPYGSDAVQLQHTLGIGDVEIMTYNGKVFFSSDSWAGRVVSYYDPRII